jgi:HEAT repeat protein
MEAETHAGGLAPFGKSRQLITVALAVVPVASHIDDQTSPEVQRGCMDLLSLSGVTLRSLLIRISGTAGTESPEADPDCSLKNRLREELEPLAALLRDQGAVLAKGLANPDAGVRMRACAAVEQFARARALWLESCETDDPLREALQQAVPRLAESVAHPDPRVRRAAVGALETCGALGLPALPALTRALDDPDRFLRWAAGRTLGRLGPAACGAAPGLTRLLQDADGSVRQVAADALAKIAPPAATVPASAPFSLASALERGDTAARLNTLRALQGLHADDLRPIVPVLVQAVKDPNPRVRQAAVAALGACGPSSREAAGTLRQSLTDPDSDVRRAAGEALFHILPRPGQKCCPAEVGTPQGPR